MDLITSSVENITLSTIETPIVNINTLKTEPAYANPTVVNSLLSEINTRNTKTPVSVLQEICSKTRLGNPVYEMVSTGGTNHDPVFNYRVLVGEVAAVGQGNNKQKAKQNAALNMIGLFNQLGQNNTIVQQIEKIQ